MANILVINSIGVVDFKQRTAAVHRTSTDNIGVEDLAELPSSADVIISDTVGASTNLVGTKYYIGSGSDWDTDASWSSSSSGSQDTTAPDKDDHVIFDSGSGSCTLDADAECRSLTVKSGYSGTLDFGDGGYALEIGSGGALFEGSGIVDLGDATITCYGDFNCSGHTGTWTYDTSTFIMAGEGTTFTGDNGLSFYDIEINANITWTTGYQETTAYADVLVAVNKTLTITGENTWFSLSSAAVATINGTVNCPGVGDRFYFGGGTLDLADTGTVTGSGMLTLYSGGKINATNGTLSIALLTVSRGCQLGGATYDIASVDIDANVNSTVTFGDASGQTLTFTGDVSFDNTNDTLTLDCSTYNPTLVFEGDVEWISGGGGTSNWNKSNASPAIRLAGNAAQSLTCTALSQSLGDFETDKSGGSVVTSGALRVDDFTGTADNDATFNLGATGAVINGDFIWNSAYNLYFSSGSHEFHGSFTLLQPSLIAQTSTATFVGDGAVVDCVSAGNELYNVNLNANVRTKVVTVTNALTIKAGMQINMLDYLSVNGSGATCVINAAAEIRGGTGFRLLTGARIITFDGRITCDFLYISGPNNTIQLPPDKTYEAVATRVYTDGTATFLFGAGDYVFAGDLELYTAGAGDVLTLDAATNTASVEVQGDLIDGSSGGDIIWSKSSASPAFTLSGGNDQAVDAGVIDDSLGDFVVNKSVGRATLTADMAVDDFTGTDGDLDVDGYTVTCQGAVDINAGFRFWNGSDDSMANGGSTHGKFLVGQGGAGDLTLDGVQGTPLGIHDLDFDYDNTSTGTANYSSVQDSLGPPGLAGTGLAIDGTTRGNSEVGGTNTGWDFDAAYPVSISDTIGTEDWEYNPSTANLLLTDTIGTEDYEHNPTSADISVSDNVGVADAVDVPLFYISISDTIGMEDFEDHPASPDISIADNIGVEDYEHNPTSVDINIADNIGVEDLAEVPSSADITISDNIGVTDLFISTKYYIGSGSDWDTDASWSSSSGGTGDTTAPTKDDHAVFDDGSGNCTLDANAECASLTVTSGYAGTLDFGDGGYTFTCGDMTFDGTGTIDCGDASITCSGNFDNEAQTTWTDGTSTLTLNGTSKTFTTSLDDFYDLVIDGSIENPVGAGGVNVANSLIVNETKAYVALNYNVVTTGKTFTINGSYTQTGYYISCTSGTITIGNNGTLAGTGYITASTSTVNNNGTWTIAESHFDKGVTVSGGTYGGAVRFQGYNTATFGNALGQTLIFTGNVTFNTAHVSVSHTIDANTHDPDIEFRGNVTCQSDGGDLLWTVGSGIVSFTGSAATQAIDMSVIAATIGDIEIDRTGGTIQFDSDFECDDLTIHADNTGTVDFGGNDITINGDATWQGSGDVDLGGSTGIFTLYGDYTTIGLTGGWTYNDETLNFEKDGGVITSGGTSQFWSYVNINNNTTLANTVEKFSLLSVFTVAVGKTFTINGPNGNLNLAGCSLVCNGTLAGTGRCYVSLANGNYMELGAAGIITVAELYVHGDHATAELRPGTYSPGLLQLRSERTDDRGLILPSGIYIFDADVEFLSTSTGDVAIDCSRATYIKFTGDITQTHGSTGDCYLADAKTVILMGSNAQSIDFGSSEIQNLVVDKAADTATLAGDLTCDSLLLPATNAGTFYLGVSGYTVIINGDCTLRAGTLDFGITVVTIAGNLYTHQGTFVQVASLQGTIALTGIGKEWTGKSGGSYQGHVTVTGTYTITTDTVTYIFFNGGAVTVNGSLTCNAPLYLHESNLVIGSSGTVDGPSILYIVDALLDHSAGGTCSVSIVDCRRSVTLAGDATFDSAMYFATEIATAVKTFGNGPNQTITFNGLVSFREVEFGHLHQFDCETHDCKLIFNGNVSQVIKDNTSVWLRSSLADAITFSGTSGTQSLDFNDWNIGDVSVDNTGTGIDLAGDFRCEDFTIEASNTGNFDCVDNDMAVGGNLLVDTGSTGTFYLGTDTIHGIAGNATFQGSGTVDLESSDITSSGNCTSTSQAAWNAGTAQLTMNGVGSTVQWAVTIAEAFVDTLVIDADTINYITDFESGIPHILNLVINDGKKFSGSSSDTLKIGNAIINGELDLDSNSGMTVAGTELTVGANGSITYISGNCYVQQSGAGLVVDNTAGGTIACLALKMIKASGQVSGGNYSTTKIEFANYSSTTFTLGTASGQSITCGGFHVQSSGVGTITFDADTYNPSVVMSGDLDVIDLATGQVIFNKSSATTAFKFTGAVAQAINISDIQGQSIGNIEIDKSADTLTLESDVECDDFTINAVNTGAVDLAGYDLVGNGNLLVDTGSTGVFSWGEGTHAITGNATFAGTGEVDLGTAQIVCSGSWDSTTQTTWVYGTSKVTLDGTSKEVRFSLKPLYDLVIDGSYTLYGQWNCNVVHNLTINEAKSLTLPVGANNWLECSGTTFALNGMLTLNGTSRLYSNVSITIGPNGSLTGTSTSPNGIYTGTLDNSAGGTCDVATFNLFHTSSISEGTYGVTNFGFSNITTGTTITFGTGIGQSIIFTGNVTYECEAGETYTVDQDTHNPDIEYRGNVVVEENATGVITWNATSGTSTFATTTTQNLDFADISGQTIGDVEIDSSGTVTLTGDLECDDLTLTSGDFDAADNDITANGNITISSNDQMLMGGGSIWTCNGNWDTSSYTGSSWFYETSTLVMNSDGGTMAAIAPATNLYNVTINGNTAMNSSGVAVKGKLTVANTKTFTINDNVYCEGDVDITGTVTGSNTFYTYLGDGDTFQLLGAGVITTTNLYVSFLHATAVFSAGTYGCTSQVRFTNTAVMTASLTAGTYDFDCDLQILGSGGILTIDCSNNPDFEIEGSFLSTGTFDWTAGTGTMTFDGSTGADTLDFDGKDVEAIVVDRSGGSLTVIINFGTEAFTGTNGDFDLDGNTLDCQGAVDINGSTGFRFWNGTGDSMASVGGTHGQFLVGQGGAGNLTLDGQSGTQLGIHDLDFDYNNTSTGTATYCDVQDSLGPAGLLGSGADINATDPSNTEIGGTNTGWDFEDAAIGQNRLFAPWGERPIATPVAYRIIFGA